MSAENLITDLKLSLSRALLGNVFPDLRAASVEGSADTRLIHLRFEFDGKPSAISQEACSCAAAEVIADFDAGWRLEEEYVECPYPFELNPLSYLVFHRAGSQKNA